VPWNGLLSPNLKVLKGKRSANPIWRLGAFFGQVGRWKNNMKEVAAEYTKRAKAEPNRLIFQAADSLLLVVDAMTGQDAVSVAEQFGDAVGFDGVVMTKLDGDARGGAALSVKAITGKPILFASTGEKLDQFERFHPDRMAQRILGMGDVMTLIEKAQGAYDEQQAADLERKLRKQQFGLDDFLDQLRQVRRLGPLQSLLGMIPGVDKELRNVHVDEREFDRIQAIILSMTPAERRRPELINGSRRLRIARGSGTNVQAVKALIKQFEQMRKVMRQVASGRMPDRGAVMGGGAPAAPLRRPPTRRSASH